METEIELNIPEKILESLKSDTGKTLDEIIDEALWLYNWKHREEKKDHRIVSINSKGEVKDLKATVNYIEALDFWVCEKHGMIRDRVCTDCAEDDQ